MTSPATRSPLLPASAIPLAYFALAHAALAAGLLILIAMPALPGGFFYHPKMVALTHFLTLGWLSGSILGAFYIAAPLALGCPMPPRRADWVACVSYAIGLVGMIAHFWIAEYRGMAWSAAMVTGAIAWVGFRGWRGLSASRTPWPIALHVRLAFLNALAAAGVGILLGLDRAVGLLTVSPLAVTYAHAHLAAIGWVGLMVVGFSYRLVPMMLPCAMPTGRALAWSAVLIESGLAVVAAALVAGSSWLPLGAVLIGAGFVSAARQLRRAILQPRPRPPLLPATDWSVWQVGGAFVWLVVAMTLGLVMSTGATIDFWYVETAWVYGVAGLVGWQGQMVAGVQGRLVPLYAWYRALARRNGAPPDISVHELPAPRLAAVVFGAWTAGVPLLAAGLAAEEETLIRTAAVLLFIGVLAGAAHIGVMLRRAHVADSTRRARPSAAPGSGAPARDGLPGAPNDLLRALDDPLRRLLRSGDGLDASTPRARRRFPRVLRQSSRGLDDGRDAFVGRGGALRDLLPSLGQRVTRLFDRMRVLRLQTVNRSRDATERGPDRFDDGGGDVST